MIFIHIIRLIPKKNFKGCISINSLITGNNDFYSYHLLKKYKKFKRMHINTFITDFYKSYKYKTYIVFFLNVEHEEMICIQITSSFMKTLNDKYN